MATKGASNHYGNSRGGRQSHGSKHIGYKWAKKFNKNTLKVHFERHGKEMGCSNENEYAAKAVHFANTIDRINCTSFIDGNNSTYKYNYKTHEFAIITKDGFVVTYYVSKGENKYFNNQMQTKKTKRRK